MNRQDTSSSDAERRVIRFPGSRARRQTHGASPGPDDLARFQGGPEDAAEYRHRMLVNLAAFVFVVALIGAAIWLADTMAKMRRDQDCVLSGRRGCSPVEVNRDRW